MVDYFPTTVDHFNHSYLYTLYKDKNDQIYIFSSQLNNKKNKENRKNLIRETVCSYVINYTSN